MAKRQHTKTLNVQKLDLSDTKIVKQIQKYSKRTIMYIC